MASKIPAFSELPLGKGDPPFSAWGLYGKNDELGMLNRLSDDVVVEAAKEIKLGKRVSLNWPLDAQGDTPFFGRQLRRMCTRRNPVASMMTLGASIHSLAVNLCSAIGDGLRHFGYQKERKFYNGVTLDDIHGDKKSTILGIQAMAKHGIVGRGILLDYHTWRQKNGIPHTAFKTSNIKLEHLKQCAKDQGTEIKFGDILIIRSGYMQAYHSLSKAEMDEIAEMSPPGLAGVEQSEEVLEWIWNNFSAVAADHPSFECWPTQREFAMHEVLLAGWGCPIGELFDLEALADLCAQAKRWSFFVTSEPCHVPGGVASPPNILAIL